MPFMKTLTLLAVLLAPPSLAAQQPGDTVTIHVSASHWTVLPADRSTSPFEILTAIINGRKVELGANLSGPDMLLPGDYRARLVSEAHESVYELRQNWEILLPGNRKRTFDLIGVRE
jgi:hypothetical protein